MALLFLSPVDHDPFKSSNFYEHSIHRIDSINAILDAQPDDSVKVGWGKAIITPEHPIRMTGSYKKPFDKIHDDVFVKTFIFKNNKLKIALLIYDLWIIHPSLASGIEERIKQSNLGISNIYFMATHTHNGPGGWADGLLGDLVIGGNKKWMKQFVVDQTLSALKLADQQLTNGSIGYGEIETTGLVTNTVSGGEELADNKLRWLKTRNNKGEQAILTTYSAHPVFAYQQVNELSADYPGALNKSLENDSLQMAAFGAGAVGAHSPIRHGEFSFENMENYGYLLGDLIKQNEQQMELIPVTKLKFVTWPVDIRSPHFRITDNIRARPWLFNAVLNPQPFDIKLMRIGDMLWVGLPVELSGEFYAELEEKSKALGLNLLITCFNGNYNGYVCPAKYYDTVHRPQVREMNWSGPDGGEYFAELITIAIDLMADK